MNTNNRINHHDKNGWTDEDYKHIEQGAPSFISADEFAVLMICLFAVVLYFSH